MELAIFCPLFESYDMSITYKALRAFQSRFPFLLEAKYLAQKSLRKLLKKPFEPDFQILASLNTANKTPVFLDIGGNRGQSIDAMRMFQSEAQIICFEPNKLLSARLMKDYANDNNLTVNDVGLGDEEVKSPLFTPYYCGFMYDGLSSFDFDEANNWINAETISWFDPKKLEIKESVCEIKRLDDFGFAPDFIKIDVQGFEKNVLIGAANTIEMHKPLIMFEINEAAEEYMRSIGWVQSCFENGKLNSDLERNGDNVFFYHPDAKEKFAHLLAA